SYQLFLAARKSGEIPAGVRFQVSLPTPLAVIGFFCPGKDEAAIERAYEKAMLRDVDAICAEIPHQDLCIQWDVCIEMLMWDGQMKQLPIPFKDVEGETIARMKRICDHIPKDVQLGIHLCYGDWKAKHFVEPIDAAKMVSLANAIAKAVSRPINYFHMPVPIGRTDDAFYQPLRELKLDPATEVYLGLVHRDGAAGTRKRIGMAEKFLPNFGIATECGMARQRSAEHVRSLLRIHADSSKEPAGAR
ncbi:MAG: hypothetical protein ACREP6_07490, partial [Candidatus Binataceae bacterium]